MYDVGREIAHSKSKRYKGVSYIFFVKDVQHTLTCYLLKRYSKHKNIFLMLNPEFFFYPLILNIIHVPALMH